MQNLEISTAEKLMSLRNYRKGYIVNLKGANEP